MKNPKENRTIVIGCDDLTKLGLILNAFSQPVFNAYSFLTVSQPDQLLRSVENGNAFLVVFAFKQSRLALNTFFSVSKNTKFPIFCFTQGSDQIGLTWPKGANVFTYPLPMANRESSIASRVASVLSLLEKGEQRTVQSFVPQHDGNVGVRDLSRYAIELDQKNAILDRIKVQLELISESASHQVCSELRSLLVVIKQSKSDQGYWNDFKEYFNKMNPDFFRILSQKHPSLTSKDLKYCCYLKMNLSNNEITRLMGINQESVRTHKYRLKKKMALSKEQNLEHYLIRVNSPSAKITA